MNQNPIVEVVAEVAKDRSKDIYDDGLKPATKEGGEILQTMFGFVNHVILHPVKKANLTFKYKLDKLNIDIQKKALQIDEENMIVPPLNIAGPTLENLKYTIDIDELREMYTSLLASSMDKTKVDDIHPSFSEIIKQLQPDEAKILEYLSFHNRILKIDINIKSKNSPGYRSHIKNYSILSSLTSMEFKNKITVYLDNLIRLSLIEIPYGISSANEELYKELTERKFIKNLRTSIEADINTTLEFDNGIIELTDFGKMFCKCCIEKINFDYLSIHDETL